MTPQEQARQELARRELARRQKAAAPPTTREKIVGGLRDFADGNVFPDGLGESLIDGAARGAARVIESPRGAAGDVGKAMVVDPAKTVGLMGHNASLALGNSGLALDSAVQGDFQQAKQHGTRALNATTETGFGALNAATVGRGGTLAKALQTSAKKPAPPIQNTEQLLDSARRTRKELADLGGTYEPAQLQELAKQLTADIPIEGIDAVSGVVGKQTKKIVKNANKPATLEQLDKVRQRVDLPKTASNSDIRDASILRGHIDDFMENVTPTGVKSGEAKAILDESRSFTRRGRSAERMEKLVEGARDHASGTLGGRFKTQETFRNKLKTFMGSKDFARLHKNEQDAVRAIVRGNGIDTVARLAGKFQPTGFASAGFGGAATAANPMLAALPIGGTAARQLADHRTRAGTKRLIKMLQQGPTEAGKKIPLTEAQKKARLEAQVELLKRMSYVGVQEQARQKVNNDDRYLELLARP